MNNASITNKFEPSEKCSTYKEKKKNGEIAISGRELHQALEVKTRYNDWFERMINYGFEENIDYTALTQKRVTAQGNTINYLDHALTFRHRKRNRKMIQRSEPGKRARQYFIQVEKLGIAQK